ncbi:MAG TPA: hypothetical protein VFE58_15095 [Tepidisphaeraceae bacterium]|nr:hypothetical protein [Tepidisphaeraceae bacterium]
MIFLPRLTLILFLASPLLAADTFQGRHYSGAGDPEYLTDLETAARMFSPDPQYQNLSMLYIPLWNGLVEGPTWDAWWIQNSYGTTYAALPLLQEPYLTFLQNSQDLWFDQMGDGHRAGQNNWVAPDGCLCDAAKPGWIYYRQGDGRIDIHDWGMEFTAAGVVMQSELLLIAHDKDKTDKYLSRLERSINFIESRRDPKNNLFLAGPAGNLLAPSFAGYKKPDGTFGKSYLTGLSVTYIAALDRMIELEKFMGHNDTAADYQHRRDTARAGLDQMTTPEGYFINSIDPDGVKHGVYGAPVHGYFESSPNHDAIALRIVDDHQSTHIYNKIASIPGLRPHSFIIPNYPSYDDMYEKPEGLWGFGTWVNGGHWSTCEARMMLAYARLGKFDDQKASFRQLMKFANTFRMDNPLTNFGDSVYQPNQPINLCYDTLGPAAALRRGLFEYLYKSDELVLLPHIPPTVTSLTQCDPARFGTKRIYLSTQGAGPIVAVCLNDTNYKNFTATELHLPYDKLPEESYITLFLGTPPPGNTITTFAISHTKTPTVPLPPELEPLHQRLERIRQLSTWLTQNQMTTSYEFAHAQLIEEAVLATHQRNELESQHKLPTLPPDSQKAADASYIDTVKKLLEGLEKTLDSYKSSPNPPQQKIYSAWQSIHAH